VVSMRSHDFLHRVPEPIEIKGSTESCVRETSCWSEEVRVRLTLSTPEGCEGRAI